MAKPNILKLIEEKADKEYVHLAIELASSGNLFDDIEFTHAHDDRYVTLEQASSLRLDNLGGITIDEEGNLDGETLCLRGGTTLEHVSFVGSAKEITIDTDTWDLVLHDGEGNTHRFLKAQTLYNNNENTSSILRNDSNYCDYDKLMQEIIDLNNKVLMLSNKIDNILKRSKEE